MSNEEITKHLENAEDALTAFDVAGYLTQQRYLDPRETIGVYWMPIWRCWKKCLGLIEWARSHPKDRDYLEGFEHLYTLAERHRVRNKLPAPVIY